jgi:hypothetical protein
MSSNAFQKDPSAVLDYEFDWSAWLEEGEEIASSEITLTPAGELVLDRTVPLSSSVIAWLSAGVLGRTYRVACHIVTNDAREDDRSLFVSVSER